MAGTTHTLTKIEEGPDGLRIVMPVPRVGCVAAFMTVWLIGWAVGELSALGALVSQIAGGTIFNVATLFLLVWLTGWTAGGLFAAYVLAMMINGSEIITLDDKVLRRRVEAFGVGLSWRYPLEQCANFRPTGDDGTFITFDVTGGKKERSIRFGTGLSETAVAEITEKVWARQPSLMPDRERRQREHAAAEAAADAEVTG